MALKGKYDFPGIKKAGTAGLTAALAGTTWGASALASAVWGPIIRTALGFLTEWLANKGLVIVNTGIELVDGQFDQRKFDVAMDVGIARARKPGLTPQEIKEIDDAVIEAFDDFADIGAAP